MGKLEDKQNEIVFDGMLKYYLKRYATEAYKIYAKRAEDYSLVDDDTLFSNKKEFEEINNIQKILESNNIYEITEKSSELRRKNPYKDFGYMKNGTYEQKVRFVRSILRMEIEVLRDVMKLHTSYRENRGDIDSIKHQTSKKVEHQKESSDKYLLSNMIKLFIEDQQIEKSWGEKNIKRNKAELGVILNILGDKQISSYTREDFIDLRKVLMKLPPNVNKNRKFQQLSYREIAKINTKNKNHKTIGINTLNTKLTILSAFFGWAELHGYINTNYAKKLTIKEKTKSIHKKLPFEKSDIAHLLSTLYHDKKLYDKNPERLWIPLIGFYNGMRLEEIAQLHQNDIYKKDGVWVFDININQTNQHKKLIKNSHSIRIIPIHPTLIKFGFIEFIKKSKSKKEPRPWMKLRYTKHGFGRNTADWFNKEIKKIKEIQDIFRKSFHSTRHTFIQKCRDSKVNNHVYKAIVGHYESDIDYNTYGKAITPQEMLDEIVKVKFAEIEEFFENGYIK